MSHLVEWIAADAGGGGTKGAAVRLAVRPREERNAGRLPVTGDWRKLPEHNFTKRSSQGEDLDAAAEHSWQEDPDIWLYRKKTTALLRRYMQWSLEAGRVPSLLGRELFRAKISAFSATTFEAKVIFLHDVERCLDRLQGFDRQLIARVVLQEHDHETAARMLQCTRRTLERRLPELIDELSESLLRSELLERFPDTREGGE